MAVLLPIERRSGKARFLLGLIYAILALGGLTMVWPFLIMVAGSFCGPYDYYRYRPIVKCLFSEEDRFMRVLCAQQNTFPRDIYPDAPAAWGSWIPVSRDPQGVHAFVRPWLDGLRDPATRARWQTMAEDFARFNLDYDPENSICTPDERQIGTFLRERYQGDIERLNKEWSIPYATFFDVRMVAQQRAPLHHLNWDWRRDAKDSAYQDLKVAYRNLEFHYGKGLPKEEIVRTMPLCRTRPYQLRPLWAKWLRTHGVTNAHLEARFPCAESPHWNTFVAHAWPKRLKGRSAETDWIAYLQNRYRTPENLARAWHAPVRPFEEIPLPLAQAQAIVFANCQWRVLWLDITANYRAVCDYLFIRGRAFLNTILLVILTLAATLTVNPMAAYALSRFRLRQTESILLFLLATMAFPTAVTAIPGFLLIRSLGLLNTLPALVLPTVANGLSIFILKGFFDALPKELYEAAEIDGAKEWQIFLLVTLPMTTPILAVNALNAFLQAYNSWEWALLVCQNESHWTLAVWMYQMSRTLGSAPWVVMAGFLVVSIPTAIVFIACQKIILRGIVLPTLK
ncbi:MAG: carbohydrate ABC transporter permease [Kiritimatiellia bacterium]